MLLESFINGLGSVVNMRIVIVFVFLISLVLSGCELLTPDTSQAFSQSQQMEALNRQTEQLERQADALELLTDLVEQKTSSTGQ